MTAWSGPDTKTCPTPRWACYIKPVPRHPVKAATIEGPYMAGFTTEGHNTYRDLECETAMTAVDLVESEMGRRRTGP
jgi:hypothetical protein